MLGSSPRRGRSGERSRPLAGEGTLARLMRRPVPVRSAPRSHALAILPEVATTRGCGRTIVLADGRQLGFDDVGDPSAPAVVYHHGFGSSRLLRHPDDSIAAQLGIR